ncbi:MAG TPA: DUF2231 domain-containing protein [Thermoanaerobaculia bacterium]|jgi:uncharacterized membrane protein|nr:DUF2231 domain-containing protein [Thermoanaerobaculia bacterium]
MRSKAAIGNHPIHPALVPIPIGAFFLALVGDVMHAAAPADPFWYDLAFAAIGIGLIAAVVAAVFGAIDYLGVKMDTATFRLATFHAALNSAALILYAVTFMLRRNRIAEAGPRWPAAMALELLAFVVLGVSGWIGGKLAFERRVGVVERENDEAGASPAARPARRA